MVSWIDPEFRLKLSVKPMPISLTESVLLLPGAQQQVAHIDPPRDGGGGGYTDETLRWAAKVASLGDNPIPSNFFLDQIDYMVRRIIAADIWPELDRLYAFCGNNVMGGGIPKSALVNLVNPDSPLLLVVSNMAHSPYNGLVGDGLLAYLDMQVKAADLPHVHLDRNFCFVYAQNVIPGLAADFGAFAQTLLWQISIKRSPNSASIWNFRSSPSVVPAKSGLGLSMMVRDTSESGFWVKRGSVTDWFAQSQGIPGSKVSIFSASNSKYRSSNVLAFAGCGGKMTKPQGEMLSLILDDCMIGLETYVETYIPPPPMPPNFFTTDTINHVTPLTILNGGTHRIFRLTLPPHNDDDTIDFVTGAMVVHEGNGGVGDIDGHATVTGTTGTGTKFQASVRLENGGIVQVLEITVPGVYSQPPTNIKSEPVVGASLVGAALALTFGTNDIGARPATSVISRPWGTALDSTQTILEFFEFVWGDRGLYDQPGGTLSWALNPNDTNGIIVNSNGTQCRTQYLTHYFAMGATLARIMKSAGYLLRDDPDGNAVRDLLRGYGWTCPDNPGWADVAESFGYNMSLWDTFSGDDLTDDVPIVTGVPGQPGMWNRAYAAAKFVTAATPSAGGHGGTDGTRTVSGTTGTGLKPVFSVRVLGGAIVEVLSISNPGLYTLQPDDLIDEPVTGSGIIGATLTITLGFKADTFFSENAYSGSFKICPDQNLFGQGRLCDLPSRQTGFVMDDEMDDDRGNYMTPNGSADRAKATHMLWAAAAHAKGYMIGCFPDPLQASGSHLGVNASNVAEIMGVNGVDFFNIVSRPNPPLDDEKAWLDTEYKIFKDAGVDPQKLNMQIFIGGPGQETPLEFMLACREFTIDNNFGGTYIANNFAAPGGGPERAYNILTAAYFDLPI